MKLRSSSINTWQSAGTSSSRQPSRFPRTKTQIARDKKRLKLTIESIIIIPCANLNPPLQNGHGIQSTRQAKINSYCWRRWPEEVSPFTPTTMSYLVTIKQYCWVYRWSQFRIHVPQLNGSLKTHIQRTTDSSCLVHPETRPPFPFPFWVRQPGLEPPHWRPHGTLPTF